MRVFKDATATEWTIELDLVTLQTIRAHVNTAAGQPLDLLADDIGPALAGLGHIETFVDALAVACKKQTEERGLSAEDFARRLRGDGIDNATEAFLAELVEFFPKKKRLVLQALMDKTASFQERTAAAMADKINSAPMEKIFQQAMENADRELAQIVENLQRRKPTATETSARFTRPQPTQESATPADGPPAT